MHGARTLRPDDIRSVYLAPDGFEQELARELGEGDWLTPRLLASRHPPRALVWAQDVWLEPRALPIASIADAARQLRGIQRGWSLWPIAEVRRSVLVHEKLPHVSARPRSFPSVPPRTPLGVFGLLDPHTLLLSPRTASPFMHGEARFVEDARPPSRAYLKLWEALTVAGRHPGKGQRCVDLGSSPGGWTWALAELGAEVLSVDKAPLDASVAALPGVQVVQGSAFALEPASVGPVSWLFSDVICYPPRLLAMVRRWLDGGFARHFVCTVKLQGRGDDTWRLFRELPGELRHLSHNKHELTWMHV